MGIIIKSIVDKIVADIIDKVKTHCVLLMTALPIADAIVYYRSFFRNGLDMLLEFDVLKLLLAFLAEVFLLFCCLLYMIPLVSKLKKEAVMKLAISLSFLASGFNISIIIFRISRYVLPFPMADDYIKAILQMSRLQWATSMFTWDALPYTSYFFPIVVQLYFAFFCYSFSFYFFVKIVVRLLKKKEIIFNASAIFGITKSFAISVALIPTTILYRVLLNFLQSIA